jgi:NAD+ synthase
VTVNEDLLRLDAAAETDHVVESIRSDVLGTLQRHGLVVNLQGDVDSAVIAALCVRAVGPRRVLGLVVTEGGADRAVDARRWADDLGMTTVVEDMTAALATVGCQARQEEALRQVSPGYGPGWTFQVTGRGSGRLHVRLLSADRVTTVFPLPRATYLQLVAASNCRQRVRKMIEYYHADRLAYAVAGGPNRLDYDQGLFVKQGDGCADIKPIAHLYKTQVLQLARHLGVSADICARSLTADDLPLPRSPEELAHDLPDAKLDLCLYAHNNGIAAEEIAPAVELSSEQVERVFRAISAKRRATRYLHQPPLLAAPVAEV